MSKITIEDISRQTGLSRGTVSRALNNRQDISVQTRERVLKACHELNYHPSVAARSLATGRCFALAVVVDDLRLPLAGAFVRGVLSRAQTDRYAAHICELGQDPPAAIDYLCSSVYERVDGMLIAGHLPSGLAKRVAEALDHRPLVVCGSAEGLNCDCLTPDHREAGRLIAGHALRIPPSDVLYVHQPGNPAANESLAGFQEVCRERRISPEAITAAVTGEGPGRLDGLRDRLGQVRAVVASDDYLAIELMMLCWSLGRVPGRDIAVVGQGNSPAAARLNPALTTTDLRGEEIGRRAAEVAIQRVEKVRQDAAETTHVPPALVVRESSRMLG